MGMIWSESSSSKVLTVKAGPAIRRRRLATLAGGLAAALWLLGWRQPPHQRDTFATTPGELRLGSARVPAQLGELSGRRGLSDVLWWAEIGRILVVDNDLSQGLLVLHPNADGGFSTEPVPLPAGAELHNGASLTTDGKYLYALSSAALKPGGTQGQAVLLRLRWHAGRLVAAGVVRDLRSRLEARVPELAEVAGQGAEAGALILEGLAWDGRRGRLLLGLSGSHFGGRPAIVPLSLAGEGAAFDVRIEERPIPIAGLRGVGIRALSFDPTSGSFLVLTGALGANESRAASKNRSALWRWTGEPQEAAKRWLEFPHSLDQTEINPEGVCRVVLPGRPPFLLVVTDGSPYYWRIPHTTGTVVHR